MKLTPAYISSNVPDATNVKSLNFANREITHLDDISYCVNLQRLDLSGNGLKSNESISVLQFCKGLTWLSLAKNKLSECHSICKLKKLQVLNLSCNEFVDLPWDHLTELGELKALIANNNIIKTLPSSAQFPKSLDTIVLSHNGLESLPTSCCRKLSNLKKISLSHNRLFQFPDLSGCWNIKEVRLNGNKILSLDTIEGALPKTVEILDLGHNVINDIRELKRLACYKKLTTLNVRGNPCDQEAEQAKLEDFFKANLPDLKILNGRNIKVGKNDRKETFRLRPDRQNKNTKITFE